LLSNNLLALLDELHAIAQLGLNFAENPYDRERYQRLLDISVEQYAVLTGLPPMVINDRFRQELGYITPKVGCAGAIFNDEGHLLLIKRSDNGKWGLPGGYAEVNRSPQDNLYRELREETGLEVEIISLVDVYHVLPGQFDWQPHTVYSLVYLCRATAGELTPSHETPEVGYFDHTTISDWHSNHQMRAEQAYARWWACKFAFNCSCTSKNAV